jgi:DNA-binding GntR family transcriptional regulator
MAKRVGAAAAAAPKKKDSTEMQAIEFLRTRSLANVVQAEVERMIVDGDLTPNERINENALAQRLGVSRGPIREACSALAAIGLIQIIPNRGFFVRELSQEEAVEVSQARAGVFACMTMMLAETATAPQIDVLRLLVERMEAIVPSGEVSRYYPVNLQFHAEIAKAAGNRRLEQMYQSLVRELHIQRYRALASGDVLNVSNAEHREIFEAISAHDPARAFNAGRAHILNGVTRTQRAKEKRR